MNRIEPVSRRPGTCLAGLHQAFEPSERLGEPILFNRSGIGIDDPVFRHAFSLVEIFLTAMSFLAVEGERISTMRSGGSLIFACVMITSPRQVA